MFEFEDGKVKRFTEYFNPLQFLKAIKPQDPPLQQELADRSSIESSQHTISTILIDLKGDTANVRSICHCPMVLNEEWKNPGLLLWPLVP